MKRKHLFWLLLPTYWALVAAAIVVVAAYAYHAMANLHFHTLENDIRTRALLLADQAAQLLADGRRGELDELCKRLGKAARTRFTVILPDGTVAGDSDSNPATMEQHGNRPEVRQALEGAGVDRRFSRTVRREMMYVAVPVADTSGQTLCAVRAALPMTAIQGELNRMAVRVVAAAIVSGMLAMGICIAVVRRITRPLQDMGRAASRFAEGDFNHRIAGQPVIEFDRLAESLNAMSARLSMTLSTLSEQRNEQEAMLSSMNEGVLAIDRKERIIHMNRVACDILGTPCGQETKRELFQQVVRHANLQEFAKAVLGSQKPHSRDLLLGGPAEKQVQASGTILRNAAEEPIGALIVLRDVTQLRHLETVRSDFVANVSHELKTPITSIKGFVETLLSDGWDHGPETLRFLEIISQQAGRLNAIIDDLLTLSRLEQKEGRVPKETCRLAGVVENAVYLCQLHAARKNMQIVAECPEDLEAPINAPLVEQALVNLIVNAVKYSEPDKKVLVRAEALPGKVAIHVKDEGFGIERRHLDRLFERFYRVDTARSRKLGGTGLGLSIIKHIVQAHQGTVSVQSRVGIGSTFTILLPAAGGAE